MAKGIIPAICFVLFAVVMGTFHYLATGINDQFGWGFGVGMTLGMGLVLLASRQARETP